MRQYESGATRDTDTDKLDYEGFLSPLVLEEYARYMHKHRIQADGNLRDSDNWQKGIPKEDYMKSMWRHFMDVFKNHRGVPADEDIKTALCAVLFNASGYLHEAMKNLEEDIKKKELKHAPLNLKEEEAAIARVKAMIYHDIAHQMPEETFKKWIDSLSAYGLEMGIEIKKEK